MLLNIYKSGELDKECSKEWSVKRDPEYKFYKTANFPIEIHIIIALRQFIPSGEVVIFCLDKQDHCMRVPMLGELDRG